MAYAQFLHFIVRHFIVFGILQFVGCWAVRGCSVKFRPEIRATPVPAATTDLESETNVCASGVTSGKTGKPITIKVCKAHFALKRQNANSHLQKSNFPNAFAEKVEIRKLVGFQCKDPRVAAAGCGNCPVRNDCAETYFEFARETGCVVRGFPDDGSQSMTNFAIRLECFPHMHGRIQSTVCDFSINNDAGGFPSTAGIAKRKSTESRPPGLMGTDAHPPPGKSTQRNRELPPKFDGIRDMIRLLRIGQLVSVLIRRKH